ncbi:hypothetical protein MNV49_002768, partial [Pseudohyphozyma bogoriensis]
MLRSSLRATASKAAPSLARSYASPAVLATGESSPTAAISVVVKAGSRYETAPGLAHVVKNSVLKSTNKRSALRIVRETELHGGVLSAALTREHLILTAEFLSSDAPFFAEILGDALVAPRFAAHEYNEEVLPQVAAEYEQANHDPTTATFDLAHQVAFRAGLGNSLFASPLNAVSHDAATSFAQSAFNSPSNFAVVATGVDNSLLKSLVSDFFVSSSPSSALSSPAAAYFGGELRVPSVGHSAVDHFLLGFKGEAASGVDFAVLKHLLGGETSTKWNAGVSPLSKLASGSSSVKAFNLGYSDAGLFGVYITAPTAQVQGLAQKAVSELQAIAKGASAEAVKTAVLKAKFEAAAAFDGRVSKLEFAGAFAANTGSAPSLEEIFAKLDGVTADSVTKAAASALKSKPTTVAHGNTHDLPYADSLGLNDKVVPSLPAVIPPPMPAGGSLAAPGAPMARAPSSSRPVSPALETTATPGTLEATGVDVEMLAADTFKPEEFLKQHLGARGGSGAQTEDLRALKTRLEGAMKITEGDLQRSVFKNYADFVVISKEIATLESEMLELKSVLEEWRAVPESLEGGWGVDELLMPGGSQGPNRRTQRNSLADLATLYKSQLSALWEGVEGSQKLLPYVPGRHLIAESASFIELNSATYKPKQNVHLFLLNDAMLVSVKKRRGTGMGGKVRLVAERCFNLSEIVVVDLKDGGDLTNAVKIKRGKETIIFRTDKSEDKKVLLMAFKKVAEELMNKKRKEMLSEAEARKGDPSNLRSARFDYDGSLPSSGFSPSEILGFGKDDPTGKDLSWIGDYSDELAVAIATRTFEEAVVLVEKGKIIAPQLADDPHASVLFRTKLDQRSTELVASLVQDLGDHSIRKSGVVRTTAWLLRLGQGEKARETFLNGRGTLVRRRARQIKFEGDISMYISELAMVCFTLIKNTCEWYMAAFKDNRMASGFVRWASEQVEIYAEMFRRQVYGADQDGKVIEESLEVTKSHGAM